MHLIETDIVKTTGPSREGLTKLRVFVDKGRTVCRAVREKIWSTAGSWCYQRAKKTGKFRTRAKFSLIKYLSTGLLCWKTEQESYTSSSLEKS